MDEGKIKFRKKVEGRVVNVLQGEISKPVIIYYRRGGQHTFVKAPICLAPKVVVKVLTPFCYVSDKAVPWNYTNQVVSQEPQTVRVSPEKKQEPSVNDIVRTGGLTRSG